MDFGGGWGRIARFFLRNTEPENIWVVDLLPESIRWLNETNAAYSVLQNDPQPPIPRLHAKFDIIYAFSVFSHLSEDYFKAWVEYLLGLLEPGGFLIFTSRGLEFISMLEEFQKRGLKADLRHNLPLPSVIRERYEEGRFQFYPIRAGQVLTETFYGEAFIPTPYVARLFACQFVLSTDLVTRVDQTIFILNNP